ncbi:MAG: glycosyltransferase family 9 protein [Calditrichaeota bacterium]|jgi:heptosyltransferase II|nr:glycosyltransferase family 9 protein [Calditrichota bacterium]
MKDVSILKNRLINEQCRILIIQTAFIGDVILMTSLIRAVRNHFPKSIITALTLPGSAPIIQNQVDSVIKFDKHDKQNRRKNWDETLRRVKDSQFDLALIPHRSFRSGLLASKAGIPTRIGFSRGSGSIFHTIKVKYPKNLYEGERNLRLLDPLSIIECSGLPHLVPSESDNQTVSDIHMKLSLNAGKYAVIAPGSIWFTKRWPADYYAELVTTFQEKANLNTLVVGGKEDQLLGNDVQINKEFNLSGKLSLMESAALIRDSAFLIAGDSAPSHLATAMGSRQIIIFGSTSPKFGFAPDTENAKIIEAKNLWCRPCTNHGRRQCPLWTKFRCMREITPNDIFRHVEAWI